MSTEKKSTILGHFTELRRRLIRSVIAVAITTIVCFIFYQQIYEILTASVPPDVELQAIEVTETLGVTMRIALIGGIILAVPYLTYEVVMFIAPALTRREKKYVYLVLPWVALMFAIGVAFGYYVMVPRMTEFLLTWGSEMAVIQPRLGDFIHFVTQMLLISGLVFEMPVLTTFLARIGVLKSSWMARRRKGAIIGCFILAAIITPTIDPLNQCVVAAPLIILYELSIWLAKLVERKKARAAAAELEASTSPD
jgi:sec-independent protein translocase protein TatC